VAELQQLRLDRAAIERKESVLTQILELLADQGDGAADEIAALGMVVGSLRDQIVQVLTENQSQLNFFMVPKGMHDQLVIRGNGSVTLDNVRITMRRMNEAGELERPSEAHTLYGLPGAIDAIPGGKDTFFSALGASKG
jgi:hypothetical protein